MALLNYWRKTDLLSYQFWDVILERSCPGYIQQRIVVEKSGALLIVTHHCGTSHFLLFAKMCEHNHFHMRDPHQHGIFFSTCCGFISYDSCRKPQVQLAQAKQINIKRQFLWMSSLDASANISLAAQHSFGRDAGLGWCGGWCRARADFARLLFIHLLSTLTLHIIDTSQLPISQVFVIHRVLLPRQHFISWRSFSGYFLLVFLWTY